MVGLLPEIRETAVFQVFHQRTVCRRNGRYQIAIGDQGGRRLIHCSRRDHAGSEQEHTN